MLRYCARPPFALERLEQTTTHQVVYHLPKAQRDGCTKLVITPMEFIDRLTALIPQSVSRRSGTELPRVCGRYRLRP